jgi:hypothetical protein
MTVPGIQGGHRRGLILGALAGTKVGAPSVFIESLLATGTDADVVIFHCDVAPETLAYLRSRNVILVPFRYHRWWDGPVHTWRFILFARYAAEHGARYDHIMTADLRDVLFQSDPFAAIATPAVHFFLEPLHGNISANGFYGKWMRRFVPRKFHRAYGRNPPICCGVILGGSAEMTAYLAALSRRLQTVSLIWRRKIGADSAMHNLIAYVTHDVPGVIAENDGIVATMGIAPEANYTIDADGVIRSPGGHVPAVVHQYDRHPALFARSRYAGLAKYADPAPASSPDRD